MPPPNGTKIAIRDVAQARIAIDKISRGCEMKPVKNFACTLAFLIFAGFLGGVRAQADMIVDTGTPTTLDVGLALYYGQWVAGQFIITESWQINSIEGFFLNQIDAGNTGDISLAVYGGGASVPDVSNELFRQSFTAPFEAPDWYGVFGMNLLLDPGTYWVAFEVLNQGDFDGITPTDAPNPLTTTAFWDKITPGASYAPDEGANFGLRIDATRVPEPSSLLLLGFGLAGLAIKQRRKIRGNR